MSKDAFICNLEEREYIAPRQWQAFLSDVPLTGMLAAHCSQGISRSHLLRIKATADNSIEVATA